MTYQKWSSISFKFFLYSSLQQLTPISRMTALELKELNRKAATLPKVSRGVSCLTHVWAENFIKEKFLKMGDDGFDFLFSSDPDSYLPNSKSEEHVIKRITKLRFKCQNEDCREYHQNYNQRKWTTYYGVVQLKCYLEKLGEKEGKDMKNPYTLLFGLKIFKQKCYSCQMWGTGSVIKSELKKIAQIYCLIIANCLKAKEPLKYILSKDEKYGNAPNPRNAETKWSSKGTLSHQQNLCEACFLNQCVYFYRKRGSRRDDCASTVVEDRQRKNSCDSRELR